MSDKKVMLEDVQTATVVCASNDTTENELSAVEKPVKLTEYVVQQDIKHAVGNIVQRQASFDDDSALTKNKVGCDSNSLISEAPLSSVVDRNKATVDDAIESDPGNHLVDRRQSTFDCSPGNLMNLVVDGKEDKHFEQIDDEVDCNKAAVVDNLDASKVRIVRCGEMVDRNKDTVDDDEEPVLTDHETPELQNGVVDRSKATVEDDADSVNTSNIIFSDCKKQTTEKQHEKKIVMALGLQIKDNCNIDKTQRTHSAELSSNAVNRKWTFELQVDGVSGENIINELENTGQTFEWNKPVIFGRGEDVDIFINDEHASRKHVKIIGQILPDGQVLFMAKNMSNKGYIVNGEHITDQTRWIPIKKGDRIRIARLVVVVNIVPAYVITKTFVVEFKKPQKLNVELVDRKKPSEEGVQDRPVVVSPTALYQTSPHGLIAQQNHHQPHSSVVPHPQYIQHQNNQFPISPFSVFFIPTGQLYPSGFSPYNPSELERLFQPYQEREGYVKISDLRRLAWEAVGEWKDLGRALGLLECQITMIDRNYAKDEGEKSYQMLRTWVFIDPEKATCENLKKGLEDTVVGRNDLVDKYCTVPSNNGQKK